MRFLLQKVRDPEEPGTTLTQMLADKEGMHHQAQINT